MPFVLVVLAPRVEVVVRQRDRNRTKRPLGGDWAVYLDRVFRTTMRDVGHWIDTSEQTPAQTVDEIVQWLGSNRDAR
jgi:hypothetical protein